VRIPVTRARVEVDNPERLPGALQDIVGRAPIETIRGQDVWTEHHHHLAFRRRPCDRVSEVVVSLSDSQRMIESLRNSLRPAILMLGGGSGRLSIRWSVRTVQRNCFANPGRSQ
jgi:hypothetical protein